ncbi:MAG: nitrogen fixation protein NifH [Chloroflexi bacterium]|nr:nitrogen fixation protein NifH [Chloroflexota bacterium]
MESWKSVLHADPTPWLLEAENPSVRYFTLVDLLDRPADDPEVLNARAAIMQSGLVPIILARQAPGGHWGRPEDFYMRSKYSGTVWQLITLGELGADGTDPRVRQACEFILEVAQDRQSGAFAYLGNSAEGGEHDNVLPCLTGNMVWRLIRLGCLSDPKVQSGIRWITTYQRFDDRIAHAPQGWPYLRERCWGRHTCHMGAVKALKALAEIPPGQRSAEINATIERGAAYLLQHHLYKRSHNLSRVAKPAWLQLGFPLMWNIDVLEMLDILTRLGYRDERMQAVVDLVMAKQDQQGRWLLEQSYNGRCQVNIERLGQPSKWLTLRALRVLKRYG